MTTSTKVDHLLASKEPGVKMYPDIRLAEGVRYAMTLGMTARPGRGPKEIGFTTQVTVFDQATAAKIPTSTSDETRDIDHGGMMTVHLGDLTPPTDGPFVVIAGFWTTETDLDLNGTFAITPMRSVANWATYEYLLALVLLMPGVGLMLLPLVTTTEA